MHGTYARWLDIISSYAMDVYEHVSDVSTCTISLGV
jgi:hypothetical protein